MVELNDRYVITSNRESGFGRYDVMLEPKKQDDPIILEFKVQDTYSGEKEQMAGCYLHLAIQKYLIP